MNYAAINMQEVYEPHFILFNYNRYLSLYQQRNQLPSNRQRDQFRLQDVDRFGKMLIELNMLSAAQHKYNKKMQTHNYN